MTSFSVNDYYNIGLRLKFPDLISFLSCNKCIHALSTDFGFWTKYLKIHFKVGKVFNIGFEFDLDPDIVRLAKHIYFLLLYTRHDEMYVTHIAFQKFLDLDFEDQSCLIDIIRKGNDEVDHTTKVPTHPLENLFTLTVLILNLDKFGSNCFVDVDEDLYGDGDPRLELYPTVIPNESKLSRFEDIPPFVFDASKFKFNNRKNFDKSKREFIKLVDTYVNRETLYLSLEQCYSIPFNYEAIDYIINSARIKKHKYRNLYNLFKCVYSMYMSEFTIVLNRKFV